ncbi:hypothetical protein C8J57DRAFT_1269389 [Mycena rebaudengoi]|nr:hypothetical protein C8J57DRAFT_1269389 [Mycena rebaudengoi]
MTTVVVARPSLPLMPDIQLDPPISFTELGALSDALEPFKAVVMRSYKSESDVRLYCTVPTWSSSSENCLDLHDLHLLRTRLLRFVHDLLTAFRSAGVTATYVLVPSDSSRCILCAGAASETRASAVSTLQKTPLGSRQSVLLADLGCPCLIIT